MSQPSTWAEIPSRLAQRYAENAEFLVKSLTKLFGREEDQTALSFKEDIYGFDKSFILLTKPGKVFAMSSFDGTILWSYFDSAHKIVKIFVEQSAGSDDRLDIIVVTSKEEVRLDPVTGEVRSKHNHGVETSKYSFILVKNVEEANSDYVVVAIPKSGTSQNP